MEREADVPFFDLTAQYREIEADILTALRAVCAAQRFILGPRVAELEEKIAALAGVKHAVGMSSGTDALLAALMALEVGPGDEVITTPFSFFATAGVIARLGARPLFCDIDPVTFNIDPRRVEEFVRSRCETRNGRLIDTRTGGQVKVLIPVHLYGQTADMEPLLDLAGRHGLAVVEDAAQAIGAAYRGRPAGGMGAIGCFSFFPTKNLGGFGDGGMCVTSDSALAERLRILRIHGAKPKYHHAVIGGNFRLDEIQAAVLLVKLRHLERWTSLRRENARLYDEALSRPHLRGRVSCPGVLDGANHVFNQYVVRVEARDDLRAHLAGAGIGTEVYYPVSLHMQPCFAHLGLRTEDLSESRRAAAETLALPIFPELTAAQRTRVVEAVEAFHA